MSFNKLYFGYDPYLMSELRQLDDQLAREAAHGRLIFAPKRELWPENIIVVDNWDRADPPHLARRRSKGRKAQEH